jgi:PAS domain S-box-containing protein
VQNFYAGHVTTHGGNDPAGAPAPPAGPAGAHASRVRPITLLVACGLSLIAAILFGTTILISNLRARALSGTERELSNITLVLAEQVDQAFQSLGLVEKSLIEKMTALGINSADDYNRQLSTHDAHSTLKDTISGLPHVEAVVLINAQGKPINSSRSWPPARGDVTDRDYFQAFESDPTLTSYLSAPALNRITQKWTIFFARKVSGPNGERFGLVLGVIDMQYFEKFFSAIALDAGSSIALFRRDGILMARYPRVDAEVGRSFGANAISMKLMEHSDHGVGRQSGVIDRVERIVSAHALVHHPLFIAATQTVNAALSEWRREAQFLVGAGLLAALLVAAVVILAARQLAQGQKRSQRQLQEQQLHLDAALNNMLQGLCMFDKDARLVLCNDRFVQMYGLSRETVKPGITFLDLLRLRREIGSLAEDPEQLHANILSLMGQGKAGLFTDEATDGQVTQILTQPVPGGGWVATYEDITGRRRAEQALAQAQGELEQAEREARAAHTLLRDAFEAVPEGLVLFDAEDRYVLWNHRYAELYALGTSHICVGMRFADVLRRGIAMGRFPEAAGREDEWIADRLARHAEVYSSHEQELPDGRWLRVEERRTADGGSIGVRIDITELKQREASFRMLFESNPLPMFVWDLETMGFLAVNDAAIDHYGFTRAQFAGMTVVDIRPVEDRAGFLNRARSFPSYYRAEGLRQYKADGSLFEADIYSRALSYNGRSARFAAVIDMTERRAAERERDRSRVFLDQIIDNIPVTIVVKDAVECRFVLINRAGENLLGLDRATALGKTAQELFPKEKADMIVLHDQQVLQADGPIVFGEHRNIARDDDNRIVTTTRLAIRDPDGNAQYMISVIEDVTERKAIEQQLQQAQKMEMVGSLTGGVAHDFNNLLTIMIGNLDLLQLDLADNAPAEHKVETILQAALRGSDLTRQMLAFSRRQPLQPKRVHVNALIGDTTRLLVRTLGENITVDLRTAAELWPTLVDGSQLEAALVNIAINARDAMPDGGTLIIETRNMQLDADYAARHLEVTPGDYVRIEITDNGTGMSPDVLARVFEPFFTTKEPGKGTGLGLSMVYGFIKQSGGHVNLYSEVGRGTTFKLYLPRAAGEIRSAVESAIPVSQPAVLGEVVLVVDDNPDVRATVVSQLRSFGYRILEADSATMALETIDRGAHIDLMFTDVVMPGPMNGKELGQVARLRRPELKVLFTSGFPGTFLNRDSDLDVGGVLLSKPYRKDDLAKAVRDLLHQV